MNKELKQKLLKSAEIMLKRNLKHDGTLECYNIGCSYCPCSFQFDIDYIGCSYSEKNIGKQWLQNWYDNNKQKETEMTKEELIKERDKKIESIKAEYDEKINKLEMLDIEINEYDNILFNYKNKNIGYINSEGSLIINSDAFSHTAYEQWIADGCPTNFHHRVSWNNGIYGFKRINSDAILSRIDIEKGNIFNFSEDIALTNCEDTNIIRYSHNNKPKRFC